MAGETEQPTTQQTEQNGQQPESPAVAQNTDTATDHMIPKSRFDEINRRFKESQAQLESLQAQLSQQAKAQEQAKTAELKEQGKYKEAFDQATETITRLEAQVAEAKQLRATVEKYQATLTGLLESQRADLPESITTLLDKLDPVEQLEWLTKNKQAVTKPAEPGEKPRPQLASFNPPGTGGPAEDDRQRVARLRKQTGQMVTPFG